MRRHPPPLRVLLVDDDEGSLDCLRARFEAAGYIVAVAENGRSALEAALKLRPDASILDCGLPDIPGDQLIPRLNVESGCEGPIVMLTGRNDPKLEKRCLDLGATSFLVKGVASLDALPVHVERLLERRGQGRTLELGRLRIDLLTLKAWVDGNPVAGLTGHEADLLRFLAVAHPYEADWNSIHMAVWQRPFAGPPNKASGLMMTTLSHLKAKLGPAARHIRTIKGRGLSLQR